MLDVSRRADAQERLAAIERVERFELAVAGALLLVVAATTYYGSRLHREFSRHAAEREAYVGRLERADAELRLSEERYALAAHSANDGLRDWDLKADVFFASPRWLALLGCDPVDGSANEWLPRVHPDDRAELESRIRAHLAWWARTPTSPPARRQSSASSTTRCTTR